MPTAMFDLVRDGKFLTVRIATKPRWEKRTVGKRQKSVMVVDAPLPVELAAFGTHKSEFPENHPFRGQGYVAVWLDLAKDESGVDVTPMLTAADWLRDRGWTVEAYFWCKSEMERRSAL